MDIGWGEEYGVNVNERERKLQSDAERVGIRAVLRQGATRASRGLSLLLGHDWRCPTRLEEASSQEVKLTANFSTLCLLSIIDYLRDEIKGAKFDNEN